ncbi:hypothetical protein WJX79_010651 [Trebouxia sp. C0005]
MRVNGDQFASGDSKCSNEWLEPGLYCNHNEAEVFLLHTSFDGNYPSTACLDSKTSWMGNQLRHPRHLT